MTDRADLLIVDELGFVPFDRAGGEMLFNPPAEAVIEGGDYLIVMGEQEALQTLEQRLAEVRK